MRALTSEELRKTKPDRETFQALPRNPIAVVVDNFTSGFNVGAVFRAADAFLVGRVYLCGTTPVPPKRRIAKTSRGTERWVPWEARPDAAEVARELRAQGHQIIAVEMTDRSAPPWGVDYRFPVCFVVGDEMTGVSQRVLEEADAAVAIPMLGMGNSMNVASALSIVLYEASLRLRPGAEIRRLRLQRGMSLRELGEKSGVSYSTICEIERGRRRPSHKTLRRILAVLRG